MTGPPKREKKVTLQELHYIIYSKGSNECSFIPRKEFLTLDKFYMSNVYNWISLNLSLDIKCLKIGKIGKKQQNIDEKLGIVSSL